MEIIANTSIEKPLSGSGMKKNTSIQKWKTINKRNP